MLVIRNDNFLTFSWNKMFFSSGNTTQFDALFLFSFFKWSTLLVESDKDGYI